MMQAISGTRRSMREMADGTIRVQVDIDPACRAAFLSMFGNIDMPVALAPLVADFERSKGDIGKAISKPDQKLKGGELARLAGMFCQNVTFQEWCECNSAEEAADWIRTTCEVSSRAELDHDHEAARRFHSLVRVPYTTSAA